jgi:ribosome maturation factor RimP
VDSVFSGLEVDLYRPLFLFVDRKSVYQDIPEQYKEILEPVVDEHGLELVDMEIGGGRGPKQVRITVDTPACDGRVDIDRCAKVSREIATLLDASGMIDAPYQLEVSSPGLNRKLARAKDFAAVVGSKVQVETRKPLQGRKRFRGELKSFDAGLAQLDVDGEEIEVALDEIAKASVMYEFSNVDFESEALVKSAKAGRKAERQAERKAERIAGKTSGKKSEKKKGHGRHSGRKKRLADSKEEKLKEEKSKDELKDESEE